MRCASRLQDGSCLCESRRTVTVGQPKQVKWTREMRVTSCSKQTWQFARLETSWRNLGEDRSICRLTLKSDWLTHNGGCASCRMCLSSPKTRPFSTQSTRTRKRSSWTRSPKCSSSNAPSKARFSANSRKCKRYSTKPRTFSAQQKP